MALGVMTVCSYAPAVGRSSLWLNSADHQIYSVNKKITMTEDSVTICTTTTRVMTEANNSPVFTPVINSITVTKQEYFKRKLAGEFGDIT